MVAYYNEYVQKRQYTRPEILAGSDSPDAGPGRGLVQHRTPYIDAIVLALFCRAIFL